MSVMGVRSLQGRPFTDLLLHNRMYLSHVYEEYGVAMLTQHGIKCRMDRRKGSGDIITESGLRIEVKSSGGQNGKTKRSLGGHKRSDEGVYWDMFTVCTFKKDLVKKYKQSDFFLFISEIGKCVFIIPTYEIELCGKMQWSIPWTEERLAGNFKSRLYKHHESSAAFLFRFRNAWHLIERAERDRKQ